MTSALVVIGALRVNSLQYPCQSYWPQRNIFKKCWLISKHCILWSVAAIFCVWLRSTGISVWMFWVGMVLCRSRWHQHWHWHQLVFGSAWNFFVCSISCEIVVGFLPDFYAHLIGHNKELIRFWRLWPNFQGQSSRENENLEGGGGGGCSKQHLFSLKTLTSYPLYQPLILS